MNETPSPLVYIVDDELGVLDSLTVFVRRKLGYRVRGFQTFAEAVEALDDVRPDALITDIAMEGREAGIDLLRRAKSRWPELPVLLMSAVGSREAAIAAVNLGAAYFLEKPFRNEHLGEVLRAAVESARSRSQVRSATKSGKHARSLRHNHPGDMVRREAETATAEGRMLVGESAAFLETLALVELASRSEATVLLNGESGVGKGALAAHLHQLSARASRPFLAVNCGALTETLLESQLFGHVRGAFTGADKDQPGLVRAAEGGTLFLDEVSELSPSTQVKLLRVLQEREVIPVGGTEPYAVDVRFIAATNRDLRREVAAGRFREDLFWRLNVFAITVPPLRERSGDIRLLAESTLDRLRRRDPHISARALSPEALAVLEAHSWPGNVRELENAIERAAIVAGEVIRPEDLPSSVHQGEGTRSTAQFPFLETTIPTLEMVERAYAEWAVRRFEGDVSRAAEALGVPIRILQALLPAATHETP